MDSNLSLKKMGAQNNSCSRVSLRLWRSYGIDKQQNGNKKRVGGPNKGNKSFHKKTQKRRRKKDKMNTMKVDAISRGAFKVGNNALFLEAASKLLMPPRNSKKTVTEVTLAHPHSLLESVHSYWRKLHGRDL